MAFVKSVLPHSPEDGMKKRDILDKRIGEDQEITARTLDRALMWLVKQGDIGERQLMVQRKASRRFTGWCTSRPEDLARTILSILAKPPLLITPVAKINQTPL